MLSGLLLPTVKCLWEELCTNSGLKKFNLKRGSYHLVFNAVMVVKPGGKDEEHDVRMDGRRKERKKDCLL